jgi:uncharacterized protein (TIGR03437 family)
MPLNKLIMAAALAMAPATRAADEELLAKFVQALDTLRIQYQIPGLAAAIVKNQQIVWERGFGYADLEQRIAAAPDTPFQIASLTKTLASTLLMQCVERGVLSLDDPIAKYTLAIPEPGVTVRHVLTHTSASVPPGDRFSYDGNRFAALTFVAESCTGAPFREVLARNILHQLRMWESIPGQDLEEVTPALARSLNPDVFDRATLDRYQRALDRLAKPYAYDSRGEPVRASFAYKLITSSAGLVSSVRDLALFDAAIDRHLLLRPETQELAWQPAVTSKGEVLPYALGWYSQRTAGRRLVWHYGNFPGAYSALYLKVPERKLSLLLLANSDRLSSQFPIGLGDVTRSPFAALFLQLIDGPGTLAAEAPAIAARGVVNAASFDGAISPGSWVTIIGQNFAKLDPAGRWWRPEDIVDGVLPTSLEGVSVRIDGQPAALCFVSPGQLNILVPRDVSLGRVSVEVAGLTGESRSAAVVKTLAPGLFTYGEWRGRMFAAAVDAGGTPLAPPEFVPGARPARPGEVILLYGTGFGSTPANQFAVRLGEAEAELEYGGVAGPGLYQFNVRVPPLPGGDHAVSIEAGGERTQPGVVIQVTTNPK